MKRKAHEAEFILGKNKSLVVSLMAVLEPGIERVIVVNEKGQTKIRIVATSGSRFEFEDRRKTKKDKSQCDFWAANLKARDFLFDIIKGKFWGQFNWGELFAYQQGKEFERRINQRIRELIDEFMSRAAAELNKIKKPSKLPKRRIG